MQIHRFFIAISLLAFPLLLSAQKSLALYNSSKKQPLKFYVGQVLHFQIHDTDFFYSLKIVDLDRENEKIIFPTGEVSLKDIAAIKTTYQRKMAKAGSRSMYIFGGSWQFYSLIDAAISPPYKWSHLMVSAVSAAVGWIIWKLYRRKIHRMGKKRYLRILEIGPVKQLSNNQIQFLGV